MVPKGVLARWFPLAATGLAALLAACSGSVGGVAKRDGGQDAASTPPDGGRADGQGRDGGEREAAIPDAEPVDAAPPFACEPESTSSPVLDAELLLDPAEPHAGDTVTVLVRSRKLDRNEAPDMELQVTGPDRNDQLQPARRSGGKALYYYYIPNVALGQYCVLGLIQGSAEISGKFEVTPRPKGPDRCQGGIFKVVSNHQWTCQEQPGWGNEIHIRTLDGDGNPLPGVTIHVGWVDTARHPFYNEENVGPPPEEVTTDSNGEYNGYDFWPISQTGELVFRFWVEGCASDVATEVTTGWWESDDSGCEYCPNDGTKNKWGHWSHTIVFQLDPTATQACVVPSDHAGQQRCSYNHLFHDPNFQTCWDVP